MQRVAQEIPETAEVRVMVLFPARARAFSVHWRRTREVLWLALSTARRK